MYHGCGLDCLVRRLRGRRASSSADQRSHDEANASHRTPVGRVGEILAADLRTSGVRPLASTYSSAAYRARSSLVVVVPDGAAVLLCGLGARIPHIAGVVVGFIVPRFKVEVVRKIAKELMQFAVALVAGTRTAHGTQPVNLPARLVVAHASTLDLACALMPRPAKRRSCHIRLTGAQRI